MFILAQRFLLTHTFIVLQFLSMRRLELRFARCNITFPLCYTNIYYPQHAVPANFVGAGHLSKSQFYKIRESTHCGGRGRPFRILSIQKK